MVIGLYYLSEMVEREGGGDRIFIDLEEAEMAYDLGDIGLQEPIKLRVGDLAGDPKLHAELKDHLGDLIPDEPVDGSKPFDTTFGRALLNTALPTDFPFINSAVIKSDLRTLIEEVIGRYDKGVLQRFLDAVKALGFRFATRSGLTIGLEDVKTPADKPKILEEYEGRAAKVEELFLQGIITDDERRQELIEIWTEATDKVKDAMVVRGDTTLATSDAASEVLLSAYQAIARGQIDSIVDELVHTGEALLDGPFRISPGLGLHLVPLALGLLEHLANAIFRHPNLLEDLFFAHSETPSQSITWTT